MPPILRDDTCWSVHSHFLLRARMIHSGVSSVIGRLSKSPQLSAIVNLLAARPLGCRVVVPGHRRNATAYVGRSAMIGVVPGQARGYPHDVDSGVVQDRDQQRFRDRSLEAGVWPVPDDSGQLGDDVSIAQVAKDVGTTVTGIQTAITLYTLVMATLMITGGKVDSMIAGAARLRSAA
jgi:hypothetical protein